MIIPATPEPIDLDALRDTVTAYLLDAGSKRARDGQLTFRCPVHDDTRPSAHWHPVKGTWVCFSHWCQSLPGMNGGTLALARLLGLDGAHPLTPAMLARVETARAASASDEAAEAERKAAALEAAIAAQYDRNCADRLAADPAALAALARRGITAGAAAVHLVGLDPAVPVRGGSWRALVWPWMDGWTVRSFQYRNLAEGDKGSRYRWPGKIGNGGAALYANDVTREAGAGPVVVVEGVLKALALWSAGWRNVVALVNSGALNADMAARLAAYPEGVLIVPDPDAFEAMRFAAHAIPGALVARLPQKPDDMVVDQGAPALRRYLDRARAA